MHVQNHKSDNIFGPFSLSLWLKYVCKLSLNTYIMFDLPHLSVTLRRTELTNTPSIMSKSSGQPLFFYDVKMYTSIHLTQKIWSVLYLSCYDVQYSRKNSILTINLNFASPFWLKNVRAWTFNTDNIFGALCPSLSRYGVQYSCRETQYWQYTLDFHSLGMT